MLRTVSMAVAATMLSVFLGDLPAAAAPLGLARARDLVLSGHSGLKGLEEQRAASEEASRQASAYANPEVEVEAENLGEDEIAAVLTLPIPLDGRRGASMKVARQQAKIAALGLRGGYLAIEAELLRRFIVVTSAQRRLELVDSLSRVSAHGIEGMQRLVSAGAAMQIDLVRAELERDELELEHARLSRDLKAAQINLCELWGATELRYDGVGGSLRGEIDLPPLPELQASMADHPEMLILDLEESLAEMEVAQARADGRPALALSGGYLRNREADEGVLIARLSLSLPVLDRNQAAVRAKLHELAAVRHEAERLEVERAVELSRLYMEIEGTGNELATVSGGVLERAGRIHDTLMDYYSHGKIGLLDVLEARQHLLEIRMRVLDLAEEQALLAADLQELTGHEINIIE
jgi:outer membrane protein TolC